MKRIVAFALALVTVLSLAACGGGGEEKGPSGGGNQLMEDLQSAIDGNSGKGAQSGTEAGQPDSSQAAPPAGMESGVEISGNKIIHTKDDGMGTHAVYEYIYQDGALSEIKLTFMYNDKATAEMVYDQMKNGELKQTADAAYQSFELGGKEIHCKMAEDYTAAFAGMNQEQMAVMLEGGDPFVVGAGDGGAAGETTINTAWSDLALPDGFPKLAEGVTEYTQVSDNVFFLSWDVISKAEADAMAEQVEKWAGGKFELMEDPAGKMWFMDTGKYNISISYYGTVGVETNQLVINVSVWE